MFFNSYIDTCMNNSIIVFLIYSHNHFSMTFSDVTASYDGKFDNSVHLLNIIKSKIYMASPPQSHW